MTQIPLEQITFHPLCKLLPPVDQTVVDELVDNIRARAADRRLDYPVLIIQDGDHHHLVDGRHRHAAFRRLKYETIPVSVCPAGDAAQIIVSTLLRRRHYSDSARAYITYPVIRAAMEAVKDSRLKHLRNASRDKDAETKTARELASEIGISRDHLFQAARLHREFESRDEARQKWHTEHPDADPATAPVDLRARFESNILSGEIALGGALAGIAGLEATKSKPKPKTKQLDLFTDAWHSLSKRFTYWGALSGDDQREAATEIRKVVLEMPEDLRDVVRKAAGKRKASKAVK